MERSRERFVSTDATPETPGELARRVLFSDRLEEKLRPAPAAGDSPDDEGGETFSSSFVPVRPQELVFAKPGGPRPSLPATAALMDEENRGVLLHFFANHELLAAELMALALLKFPDAPREFRLGLAETLREEQRHTRWYLNRMAKCGVVFGQYPVNRFFWDAVAPMESPVDYVARLSLTFEQANLDYSRHFAEVLEKAGDPESAAILSRIYRDEIGHVGYGLKWFREWKDEKKSDWAALAERLPFPLSPSRAKGNGAAFNAEGRREAGLDEDYIARLELFERSKGRTPDVHWFNPEAENCIARYPHPYHPKDRVRSVIEDLEILPAFLAARDDVVAVRRAPSPTHLAKLSRAGFILPEFATIESGSAQPGMGGDQTLLTRKLHRLRPWAKAPDLGKKFGFVVKSSSVDQPSLGWQESDAALFSKAEQAARFPELFGMSFPVRDDEELATALAAFREAGVERLILKRAHSTAGGGSLRTTVAEIADRGLQRSAAEEGGIVLEQEHERVFDFSVLYEMAEDGLRWIGATEQIVSESGAYRGTVCFPKIGRSLDPETRRVLTAEAMPRYRNPDDIPAALETWLREHHYRGPVGIDAYLHRDGEGHLRHRLACEINVRNTMGRIAHELRRRVASGHGVKFEIARADAPIEEDFVVADGRIVAGTIALTEPQQEGRFVALLTVAKRRGEW